jgi:hypothetical protein
LKVIVPHIGELRDLDDRMCRLIEFVGVSYETLALPNVDDYAEFLAGAVPDSCSCFVVNARVMREWVGANSIPSTLIAFLLSRFPNLLVHGLRPDKFDNKLVAALSGGTLTSVEAVNGDAQFYRISEDSRKVCEAFSGLSFGPVNSRNDHVFRTNDVNQSLREFISIDGLPFMAGVRVDKADVFFVASEDIADLNTEVGDAPLSQYFSRLLPHAMALRYIAGDDCWRPRQACASIIIDDPLLRETYGFLNFGSLLKLLEQYKFHITIAFIPHNFRRNSPRIMRMFQENAANLSICFHGNNHTEKEYASSDPALLNTLTRAALDRMDSLYRATGLSCDRIMVFPQGYFSIEALEVLKSHSFHAAVNAVTHPSDQSIKLTLGDLAQPSVLRYGGFPFFIRKPIQKFHDHDIAFNLFFGRPILIVEHHDIFQNPALLVDVVRRINSLAPDVHWGNLTTDVGNSILTRRAADGTHRVRAFSGSIQISNHSDTSVRYIIEWGGAYDYASIAQVFIDGSPWTDFNIDNGGLRLSIELPPRASRTIALANHNVHAEVRNLGVGSRFRAFLRRRLSELRDNYLSKNHYILTGAKAVQRRFLRV